MSSQQDNRGGAGFGAATAREQSAGNAETGGSTHGTAPSGDTGFSADAPNFGSARSDYGSNAYGGRLDEAGLEEGGDARSGDESSGAGGFPWDTVLTLLAGIGIGAALMYVLDPDQGGQRRAVARDKIAKASDATTRVVGSTARDLRDRAQGVINQTGKAFGFGGGRGGTEQQGRDEGQAAGDNQLPI